MLLISRRTDSKSATNGDWGNLNVFLERLLIEVVSANYRYFLQERLRHEAQDCWPPLLSRERQVSGLFAQALSNVCPVSLPELAIQRIPKGASRGKGKTARKGLGRLDYFAVYGERSIGMELKAARISTELKPERKFLCRRWDEANEQARQALSHMRSQPRRLYPLAASVALLVVRIGRTFDLTDRSTDTGEEDVSAIADNIAKLLQPDFLAAYAPPREMQVCVDLDGKASLFPGVVFAGKMWLHARQM